jgi:Na+-driven multidrug efflux pump
MATQISISNTLLAIFLAEVGISHAIINVISKSMSERRLASARRKAFIGAFISLCIAAVIVVELVTYEHYWLTFFTREEMVISRLKELESILFLIIFLDFFQIALASILKAMDMHRVILKVYLYCFYIIGLGSGSILCFYF